MVAQNQFMTRALELAEAAAGRGEVPVGAVVARGSQIVAQAANRMRELQDATAHAELLAIRAACDALGSERLTDCDLYVTLEPCTMCAGAISLARLRRLYYGAEDPKGGAIRNGVSFFAAQTCHHKPEVYSGIREREAALLLRTFFEKRRAGSGRRQDL